jgi:hypothetical protein
MPERGIEKSVIQEIIVKERKTRVQRAKRIGIFFSSSIALIGLSYIITRYFKIK